MHFQEIIPSSGYDMVIPAAAELSDQENQSKAPVKTFLGNEYSRQLLIGASSFTATNKCLYCIAELP